MSFPRSHSLIPATILTQAAGGWWLTGRSRSAELVEYMTGTGQKKALWGSDYPMLNLKARWATSTYLPCLRRGESDSLASSTARVCDLETS